MKKAVQNELSVAHGGEGVADELKRGEVISERFVVESPIGAGGMGRIYLAYQRPFNRPVALKVMHRKALQNRELVERFFQEASTVSHLAHPNTVTLYDFGRTDSGLLYIAMELVEGISLGDEVKRRKRIPADEAIPYAIQIAQSLGEAHHKNLIHRDLKPDNVMVCRPEGADPFVKVLDFGIAKVLGKNEKWTKVGNIVGTPFYMAPEQARGNEVDGRTDLYSLGCCLFEMLTGAPPYLDDSPVKVLMSHQNDPIPTLPKGYHPALDDFIRRALAKDPNDRPADAATFAAELLATVIEMRSDNAMSGQIGSTGEFGAAANFDSSIERRRAPIRPGAVETARSKPAWRQAEQPSSFEPDDGLASGPTLDAAEEADGTDALGFPSNDSLRAYTTPTVPPQRRSDTGASTSGDADAPKTAAWFRSAGLIAAVLLLVGLAFFVGRDLSSVDGQADDTASPVPPSSVVVNFDSAPDDATVYVNGLGVGTTPLSLERPVDDVLDIRFERSGFRDFAFEGVQLSTSADNRIFAPMKAKPLLVTVESPVSGTTVELGGKSYGSLQRGVPRTFELPFPSDQLEIKLGPPGHEPYIDRANPSLLQDTYRVAPTAEELVPSAK